MTHGPAARWIRFLRQYGPIPRNDNMYAEHIRKSARRAGVLPLAFTHPIEAEVLPLLRPEPLQGMDRPSSIILTGTAGDGKSHLCGKIWNLLGGGEEEWDSDDVYHTRQAVVGGKSRTVHVIRDLTAMPETDPKLRYTNKAELLTGLCQSLYQADSDAIFLIAANDGQLVENFHKLPETSEVVRVRDLVETLLVESRSHDDSVPLRLFNLSRVPCTVLFDLALNAFVEHGGWQLCYAAAEGEGFFGGRCPIRHNYELLKQPLVRARLRALFELCDCNDLHVPIRRLLLLLANSVLGHPDAKDRLLQASEVAGVVHRGTVARASLFNNIFGGNLSEVRRESLEVFDYLSRFRVGHETSNRVDNILIFGEADDVLRPYFDELLRADSFYGADASYYAAQRSYVEGLDADGPSKPFLDMLVSQRRGLFFKIPEKWEAELALWELTVFKYAGEYLNRVVKPLQSNGRIERPLLSRLVRGLNRIFVGMLVGSDRELVLATSVSYSTSKVSQVLEDRIPVAPRMHERVDLVLEGRSPTLVVQFAAGIRAGLPLNLTRYEFLSRVAEGALPSSFSRECYEDMLAFKSRLLGCLSERRRVEGLGDSVGVSFRLLSLDASGTPLDEAVELADA